MIVIVPALLFSLFLRAAFLFASFAVWDVSAALH